MIYNIKGIMVEILDEQFPVVNIQIPETYPELIVIGEPMFNDPGNAFGVYFELMFESGTILVVSQEAAHIANRKATCEDAKNLDHFLVEEHHRNAQTLEPFYAWHCSGEEELLSVLRTLKKNLSASSATNFAA